VLYNVICGALFLLMKLAEKRLLRPAERAWANQERFVEDASHEMKTPIAVILSNAELGVSEQPEETERRLSVILNEAQRMKLLITRMLESARIENEAHKRRSIADFSLSDAVTECALLFEEPLYEQGIALSYDVEENLWVRSDETSLKQVLRILLENAGKYTPRGQRVQMRVRRRFSRAEIAVRNEGVGIDPNECEAIFERFYRAGEVRAHTEGSYGLGLSIAKTMIEMIGGSIRCESDGQTYTSFVVTVRSVRKQK
jgi:signal transduction histidine kinase